MVKNSENVKVTPLEVKVENDNFEEACKKFKSLFQKERVIGKLKEKQFYEKPSDKKRRKRREARERKIMVEMRERLIKTGEWEKRIKKRKLKKQNIKYQVKDGGAE